MAYYYVKSGYGTASSTPSSTAKQSGAFSSMSSSDVYASVTLVSSLNVLADGDIICLSDLHDETNVGDIRLDSVDGIIHIISVDDSNVDQYSAGAAISSTTFLGFADDVTFRNVRCTVHGVTFNYTTHFNGGTYDGTWLYFKNCTFDSSGTLSSHFNFKLNNSIVILEDCDVYAISYSGSTLTCVYIEGNGEFIWNNGTLHKKATYNLNYLVGQAGTNNYGLKAYFTNVDISDHTDIQLHNTTSYYRYASGGVVRLNNCTMPSTWTYQDIAGYGHCADFIFAYNTSNSNNYYIGHADMWGTSQIQTTYTRTSGLEIDGTAVAYSVATESICQDGNYGHKFLLGTVKANFDSAKTVRVELLSSSTKQDDDIWIEVYVPEASGPLKSKYSSKLDSSGQGGIFFTDSPASYSSSSESWTGSLGGATMQYMEITTDGSEGNGFAEVYVVAAKPSTTFYVDPKIDVT